MKEASNALDKLLTYKAEGALRFSNQRYYEMGNRASRRLAFQLCKAQASRVVSCALYQIRISRCFCIILYKTVQRA